MSSSKSKKSKYVESDDDSINVLCYHLSEGNWDNWTFDKKELIVIDHLKDWRAYNIDEGHIEDGPTSHKMSPELLEAFESGNWGCQKRSVKRVLSVIQELIDKRS